MFSRAKRLKPFTFSFESFRWTTANARELYSDVSGETKLHSLINICLFVLRFYGPLNPMGSCRAVGLPNHTITRQA